MKRSIATSSLILFLTACGGSGGSSSSDTFSQSLTLPSATPGVDSSDPEGIWVSVGTFSGTRSLEQGNLYPEFEEGEPISQNLKFTGQFKGYFVIKRDDDGNIYLPCSGVTAEYLSYENGSIVYDDISNDIYDGVREQWNDSFSIKIADSGIMTMISILKSTDTGVSFSTSGYKSTFERKDISKAVKVSDSTDFNDLYEFSIFTTNGVESYTHNAQSGDEEILCIGYEEGKGEGTQDSSPHSSYNEYFEIRTPRAGFYMSKTISTLENKVYHDAISGSYSDEFIADCDQVSCSNIMDIDANDADSFSLNSVFGDFSSEIYIRTAK